MGRSAVFASVIANGLIGVVFLVLAGVDAHDMNDTATLTVVLSAEIGLILLLYLGTAMLATRGKFGWAFCLPFITVPVLAAGLFFLALLK